MRVHATVRVPRLGGFAYVLCRRVLLHFDFLGIRDIAQVTCNTCLVRMLMRPGHVRTAVKQYREGYERRAHKNVRLGPQVVVDPPGDLADDDPRNPDRAD